MILRWLGRELRDFPATFLICMSWLVVFAAMSYGAFSIGVPPSASQWLLFGFSADQFGDVNLGEQFGDVSLSNLARGQFWRLITCNFVHYSLVHFALNLLAMYQLGGLVENWYGPYQLVFIYGLTGGGGNAISALVRRWLRSNPNIHAAGGSVVIMGLIGLCAVAGWRLKNHEGQRLSLLMLLFIALTAALGAIFPQHIDNWGHAGGLVVGAALGLAHRWFTGRVGKPSAWGCGLLTGLIIVGCGATQFVVARREAPARLERVLVVRTNYLARATRDLGRLRGPDDPPELFAAASRWLTVVEPMLAGAARLDVQALRPLIDAAQDRPLSDAEEHRLRECLTRLTNAMIRQHDDDQRRLLRLRGKGSAAGRPGRLPRDRAAGQPRARPLAVPRTPAAGPQGRGEVRDRVDRPLELGEVTPEALDLVRVAGAGRAHAVLS
jgi:membrane associated rhomboid family serine protease